MTYGRRVGQICLLLSKLHTVWEIFIFPILNFVLPRFLRCLRMNQHSHKFIARCLMCSHDAFNFSHIIQPSLSSSSSTPITNVAITKNTFQDKFYFLAILSQPFQVSQTQNRINIIIIFLYLHHQPHDHADLQVWESKPRWGNESVDCKHIRRFEDCHLSLFYWRFWIVGWIVEAFRYCIWVKQR